MDLYKLKCFYEVAINGNYVLAGKSLGKTSAAVGQNVRDLEKQLNCTLFRRTYRGLTLTQEGQKLLEGASKIFKEAYLLENSLMPKKEISTIKVLATVGITSDWIVHFVPHFLKKHPKVTLEFSSLTTMNAFDLQQHDVYMGEILKKDPKYVYKFVKTFRYLFYASPTYIKKHGQPKGPKDLKNHRIIEFNLRRISGFSKTTKFFEEIDANEDQKILIDSTMGEYKLAEAGVGIACLCEELSDLKNSNLVPVLTDVGPLTVEIYFVYHDSLRDNKTIKALLKEVQLHI